MLKTYKMMFILTLILSTLITISSYSWFSMWMGLEINLLSMITLMNKKLSIYSPESMIKYFIIQSTSSSLIMMCMIIESLKNKFNTNITLESTSIFIMNLGILMKMSSAPFHFWLPEVIEGTSWMICLIILTWQKIAPMIILMYNLKSNNLIMWVISISMIMSSVLSYNLKSLRKIMAYSSINHSGWMISSLLTNMNIWLSYFVIYTIIMTNLIFILNLMKIFYINQINNLKNEILTKFILFINFLSLSGIPPFIGFFPKWLTIQALINNNMYILSIILLSSTIMLTYIYMQLSINFLIISNLKSKWNHMINFKYPMFMFLNFSISNSLIISTISFNMT